MERTAIHNIVVRFFSDRSAASDQAGVCGMKVYQHAAINQFVVSPDISVEFPEIFDTTGVIFSQKTQSRDVNARNWISEFVKDLQEV